MIDTNLNTRLPVLLLYSFLNLCSCVNDDSNASSQEARTFKMGFTTWSYGPNLEDVNDTYNFIENNADIYAEHIDSKIPWNAWMNDSELPVEFTNEITSKANRKIPGRPLLLSVGLFNMNRDELAEDFDGSIPAYNQLSDSLIEEAYFKHVSYLLSRFSPDYLVIAIEVNEFRIRNENQWEAYKILIANVTSRIRQEYPQLPISESVSLHNLYQANFADAQTYINELLNYMNSLDFIAISFYPFFLNLNNSSDFQQALDFVHNNTIVPIAFVETSHIAENLNVPNLNLAISGNEGEQLLYLKTLVDNAQANNYEFVIWWTHRDYDALWDTFPEDLKAIGQLWRDSGLLDENGVPRPAYTYWQDILEP